MTGGLTQLVAYGAQDVYLTGDPQVSFWKGKFNRYRNFATESIQLDVLGDAIPGGVVTVPLIRNGDLVMNVMINAEFQRGSGTAYYPIEQYIKEVELFIGGQRVLNFNNEWFRIYYNMMLDVTQKTAYRSMTEFSGEPEGYYKMFYLPLPLWFNSRELSNALPLIALQYHNVELRITLENLDNIPGINPSAIPTLEVYGDYVFLDSDERIQFAQKPHQYIIDQVQYLSAPVIVDDKERHYNIDLNFNHPTKCLIWALTGGTNTYGQYTGYPGSQALETLGPIKSSVLTLNGIERFSSRSGGYFNTANPWTYFSCMNPTVGIYAYGFGLKSDQFSPSGTCNFSRIDNARLRIHTKAAVVSNPAVAGNVTTSMTTVNADALNTCIIFAPNYNVLRIESGMGGVAFAS